MTVHKASAFMGSTRPEDVTPVIRRELVHCWESVATAGGAVIAAGFPLPPVSARDVGPVADALSHGLDARCRWLLIATVDIDIDLAGWLWVATRPDRDPPTDPQGSDVDTWSTTTWNSFVGEKSTYSQSSSASGEWPGSQ